MSDIILRKDETKTIYANGLRELIWRHSMYSTGYRTKVLKSPKKEAAPETRS
jgi:hypothetical protein